jgi:hypothetical protein
MATYPHNARTIGYLAERWHGYPINHVRTGQTGQPYIHRLKLRVWKVKLADSAAAGVVLGFSPSMAV